MSRPGVAVSRDDTEDREWALGPERGPGRDRLPSRTRAANPDPAPGRPTARERVTEDWLDSGTGVPGRRTVTIRGRGAERYTPRRPTADRRRSERRHERPGFVPDRTAMWAVLLGVLLLLVAAASAHAATLHAVVHLH